MKKKIVINYTWWNSEKPNARISKETMQMLSYSAKERIKEMSLQGIREGELNDDIDEVNYTGFWEIIEK